MSKYNSISNIPAKLFFDILETKDFNLLEPIEGEDAEEVFVAIYDDYFVKSNNYRSNEFLRLRQEIDFMEHKIQSVVQVLDFLMFNETDLEIRNTLLQALKDIGIGIDLEGKFEDEIRNVLQVELGLIENELNIAKFDLENLTKIKDNKQFDYFETIVNFETILERNLPDEILLIKFIYYEKMCDNKIKAQSKKSIGSKLS
jgi:hypothetical protein